MFDFGESRIDVLEIDLEKRLVRLVLNNDSCSLFRPSLSCLGGVNGEIGLTSRLTLPVLVLGDGVRGIRPPAVRVENMLWWLFRGVDTAAVAIVQYLEFQMLDK